MFEIANYVESGLWATIAVIFLAFALRRRSGHQKLAALAGVVFLAFDLSDVVEVRTGAWWRPWWLLVWKGARGVAMIALLVRYRRQRSAESRHG